MAKRLCTSDLDLDNLDDDEPEEKGTYTLASEEEISHRIIKRARRRFSNQNKTNAVNPFQNFSSFVLPSSSNSTPNTGFEFLKSMKINQSGMSTSDPDVNKESVKDSEPATAQSDGFLHMLRALNEGLLLWIKQHLDKNPYCDLTPVFNDYKKHLSDLETKYKSSLKNDNVELIKPSAVEESKVSSESSQKFFTSLRSTEVQINFFNTLERTQNIDPLDKAVLQKSAFSFVSDNCTQEHRPETEETEEPPKVQEVQISEDDALFSQR